MAFRTLSSLPRACNAAPLLRMAPVRAVTRHLSTMPETVVAPVPTPLELPTYPDDIAAQRKRVINSVVEHTEVGKTPRIPPQGYLDEENRMWSCVYRKVASLATKYACPDYLQGLLCAGYRPDQIPDIEELDNNLYRQTGWRIAPVTGSLAPELFFEYLARCEMPCTMYIRPHTKFTFTPDPDCIHEMLGHIPALFTPSWSRLYLRFGLKAAELQERQDSEAMEQLILVYFAIVEKGMVRVGQDVRAMGASLISGTGELQHAMQHPEKQIPLHMDLVMKMGSTDEEGFMPFFFVGSSVDEMAEQVMQWIDDL